MFLIIYLEKIEKRYSHINTSEFPDIWIIFYTIVTFVTLKKNTRRQFMIAKFSGLNHRQKWVSYTLDYGTPECIEHDRNWICNFSVRTYDDKLKH